MSDDDQLKERRLLSQEKRAANRQHSAQLLQEEGITFESRNAGAHIIIRDGKDTVNFWPGTGLWVVQGLNKQHRGVRNLINHLKGRTKP